MCVCECHNADLLKFEYFDFASYTAVPMLSVEPILKLSAKIQYHYKRSSMVVAYEQRGKSISFSLAHSLILS